MPDKLETHKDKVGMLYRLRQQRAKWKYLLDRGGTDRPNEVKTLLYAIRFTIQSLEQETHDTKESEEHNAETQ